MIALVEAALALRHAVRRVELAQPVTHVYDPLEYAWDIHRAYLARWGGAPREVLFVGMNPGPFGMAQTGIPFGDPELVREFLGLSGPVGTPARVHPKRPVLGFASPRGEVSGRRLWGAIRDRFGTAERFFARHFVVNYCPLAFMDEAGRNVTPDKLPATVRAPLERACDRHLRVVTEALSPAHVIGVGRFAEARARAALEGIDGLVIGRITHPSPANPLANRDWAGLVEREMAALGLLFAP